MYELKQIEIFLVAAEELNFHNAAERLNTTQPSISKAISLLEHQLKRKLFNRTTRNISLTEEGIAFYNQSLSLYEKMRELSQKISQSTNFKEKIFKIGTSTAAYISILPKVIDNFKKHHQESIQIEVDQLNTGECISKLVSNKIDVGIVILPAEHKDLKVKPIYKSNLKLAVSKYHPYSKRKKLPLAMFGKDTFIMHSRDENSYIYDEIISCYKKAGITPKIRETKVNESCMGMTVANLGIHFIPKEAENMFIQHELACITVTPSPSLKLGLAWHKDNSNLLTQAFINEVDFISKIQG